MQKRCPDVAGAGMLAGQQHGQADILDSGEGREQAGRLEHEADLARPQGLEWTQCGPFDAAGRRPVEAAKNMQQRRLAAARRSDERDPRARRDLAVDIAQHADPAGVTIPEVPPEALCDDERFSHGRSSRPSA
ncbi:hypothetical protein MesoLj113b_09230 [Mesorhizobium sp. 113-3-3]|nr:hypothetical protein MesoLj113b_09230 [Mesorhizobium sp. 113-3-3]